MTDLTDKRLEEMAVVAGAATPGPWAWYEENHNPRTGECSIAAVFDGTHPHSKDQERVVLAHSRPTVDAAHIATFNPTNALSLISEIQRLRKRVGELEGALAPFAEEAGNWAEMGDTRPINTFPALNDELDNRFPTAGDLRRARSALKGEG